MAKALRPIIRDLLCCPTCNGELTDSDQALTCAACDQAFPVVEGVPVMIAGADPEQFVVGEFERFGPVSEHDYAPRSLELIERHRDGLVLDLGAGGKDAHFEHVVQVDIFRFPRTDVVCRAESLPFKPGRFSGVVSQAVFEHLRYPEMAAAEIFRVCKPGAEIKIDTAFLQAVHGYPDHYYNATLSGLKHWFHMFYIEWEGVEPYQRPYIALAQLTDFLLENLSGACRAVAGSVSLRELLEVIGAHSTGRPLDEQGRRLIKCLNQVNPDFEDRIAAGVSILARKPLAADAIVSAAPVTPATSDAYRREAIRRIDLEAKLDVLEQECREVVAITADTERLSALRRQLANDAKRRFNRRLGSTLKGAVLQRIRKRVGMDQENAASGSVGVSLLVVLRDPGEARLRDFLISLDQQKWPVWELIIGWSPVRSSATLARLCKHFYQRQPRAKLHALAAEVRDDEALNSMLCRSKYPYIAVLEANSVLDSDALEEVMSLAAHLRDSSCVFDVISTDEGIEDAAGAIQVHKRELQSVREMSMPWLRGLQVFRRPQRLRLDPTGRLDIGTSLDGDQRVEHIPKALLLRNIDE